MAIHKTFPYFAKDLEKFADTIDRDFGAVVKTMGFTAFESAMRNSPVRTGRFRGSWRISLNSPGNDPGLPPGGTYGPNVNSGETGKLSSLSSNPYQTIFIYNNLSYAERLDTGWSKQKPSGITVLVELELLNKIEKSLKLVAGS